MPRAMSNRGFQRHDHDVSAPMKSLFIAKKTPLPTRNDGFQEGGATGVLSCIGFGTWYSKKVVLRVC
jgi:hypothetical protein